MSNIREEIKRQISNKSFEQIHKEQQNRAEEAKKNEKGSFLKEALSLLFWRFKVIAGILGINEKDITSSKGREGGPIKEISYHSTDSLRDRYHHEPETFNPEKYLIKEMAHEAYYKMVDGKGDHDCGHEH